MDYSASIPCSGNVLTEPLSSNGHIRHNIYNGLIYSLLKPHSNLLDILYCSSVTRSGDKTWTTVKSLIQRRNFKLKKGNRKMYSGSCL
jgi:hypothetical protein